MLRNIRIKTTLILLVVLACHISAAASAQRLSDGGLGGGDIQQAIEEGRRRADEAKGVGKPESRQKTAPPVKACLNISAIDIQGNSLIAGHKLAQVVRPFENRCITVSDIDLIIKTITSEYIERGFITSRAYIPEQSTNESVLTVVVIEGHIEDVYDSESGSSLTDTNVFKIKKGSRLNMRDIEQALDQINRLPSYRAKSSIEPGETTGGSRVQIQKTKTGNRLHPRIVIDNSGNKTTTGNYNMTYGLALDDPLGFNDRLDLSVKLNTAYEQGRKIYRTFSYSYDFPLAYWNLGFSGENNHTYYIIERDVADIINENNTSKMSVYAKKVLLRDGIGKVYLQGDLGRKTSHNLINNRKIERSNFTRYYAKLGLSLTHTSGNGSNFSLNGSVNRGLNTDISFTDSAGRPVPPPSSFAHENYVFFNLDATASRNFDIWGVKTNLSLSAKSQMSRDNLFSDDLFSIGGSDSVPGFKEDTLSANSGYYANLKLTFPDFLKAIPSSPSFYVGLNYGATAAMGDDTPLSERSLSSWSAGVSTKLFDSLTLSLDYGKAIRYPKYFLKPKPEVTLNITWSP